MARKSNFIEQYRQELTNGEAPVLPVTGLDETRSMSDLAGDPTNADLGKAIALPAEVGRVPIQTLSPNHVSELWQRAPGTDPADLVFQKYPILSGAIGACLVQRDVDGKPLYYKKEDLDLRFPGWRPFDQADHPYPCPSFDCRTRLPNAQTLLDHVSGFHESLFAPLKKKLEKMVEVENTVTLDDALEKALAKRTGKSLVAELAKDARTQREEVPA